MARVLVLCEFPTFGGGERSFWAAAPHLERQGLELTMVAPPEGPWPALIRQSARRLLPWAWQDTSGHRRELEVLRGELAALLAQEQPDLVVANSLSTGRMSGPVCRALKVPSVAHLRDILGLGGQQVADLNLHDRLLAVSAATRQFHIAQGLDPQRTHVAVNGVDLEELAPRPASGYLHRELGLPPEALLVGSVGQVILRKGWDTLLAAAGQLAPRWPELHWLLVGERHSAKGETVAYEARLHEQIATLGLAGRVHWQPARGDVPRWLAELAIYVHPARQEPLGRVLLEAAATSRAVVATDVGGTAEIFGRQPSAAELVPAGDADALAEAIEQLLRDRGHRAALGRAARARAEAHFDVRRTASAWAEHYWAVVRQTPQR